MAHAESSTSERERMLGRIRDALRTPAPRPAAHGGATLEQGEDASRHGVPDYTDWLPLAGKDFAARVEWFSRNAADLKAEFHLLENESDLQAQLQRLATDNGWQRIAAQRGALADLALQGTTLPVARVDDGYRVEDMEASDAGLTECECLVAQTGSVLVSSRASGGRASSVLPPHHVVVARASQMVGDLTEAFAGLREKYGTDYPSMLSFVTGPSRTGDIERILVLGAHGPKRLTIFCIL